MDGKHIECFSQHKMRLEIQIPDFATAMKFIKATPPEGVRVECEGSLAASVDSGFHIYTIIDFTSDVAAAVLAGWILSCFEKAPARKTRINGKQTMLNAEKVERRIQAAVNAKSVIAANKTGTRSKRTRK